MTINTAWPSWPIGQKQRLKWQLRRELYRTYQDDPVGFARDILRRSFLTDGQMKVLESVRDNPVTIVKSANAVGKTYCAADVGLWFNRCFEYSKVFTAAAPPIGNLEKLLWGEINACVRDVPELIEDVISRGYLLIEMHEEWYLTGVTIPQSGTSAEREAKFSGKHAPHLLFIIDEGDAVPEDVYRGIESCMSGGHVRLLILFNPREQSGPVYQKTKSGANVIELDAFSHPNVATGKDVIPGAVSREITVKRISKWSRAQTPNETIDPRDLEWFQIPPFLDGSTATMDDGSPSPALIGDQWRKVTNPALSYMTLARYPGQSETQLISRAWVEAAIARGKIWREQHGDEPPKGIRPLHGQDVAEFGSDNNMACVRYQSWVAPLEEWNGVDIIVTGDRSAELAQARNAQRSFVDATGVGSGVAPQMARWWKAHRSKSYNGEAIPVKVGESPTESVEEGAFNILRDQLWWRCREWLRTDPQAMLPDDEALADELCAPKYRQPKGKIMIDNKDMLRKLLKRSPDRADALCLTFAPEQVDGKTETSSQVHEVDL